MDAKKCDRCNGYFRLEDMDRNQDESLYLDKLKFRKRGGILTTNLNGVDFCPTCTMRFREFMKGESIVSEVATAEGVMANGD